MAIPLQRTSHVIIMLGGAALILAACSNPATPSYISKSNEIFWPGVEEQTPLIIDGRVVLVGSLRPDEPFVGSGLKGSAIEFRELTGNKLLARYKTTLAVCSALVQGNDILTFCARDAYSDHIKNTIVMLRFDHQFNLLEQSDLFDAPTGQVIDNTSVAFDGKRWVMAYQTAPLIMTRGGPGHYDIAFMQSDDLKHWRPIGKTASPKHDASAPTLRFVNGKWALFYTTARKIVPHRKNPEYEHVTALSTSSNLENFSTPHVVLAPTADEWICNCDTDVVELNGKTLLIYQAGDQHSIKVGGLKVATYPGLLASLIKK